MKNVLMFLLGFFVGSATILCFEIKGQRIREEKEEQRNRYKRYICLFIMKIFIMRVYQKIHIHIKFIFNLLTNIGLSHIILKLIKCKSIYEKGE